MRWLTSCNFHIRYIASLYDNELELLLDLSRPLLVVGGHQIHGLILSVDKLNVEYDIWNGELVPTTQRMPLQNGWSCAYRNLLRSKREQFWTQKIESEKSSPRQLWSSIDVLLGRGATPPSDKIDAKHLHRYFDEKVASVQSATSGSPMPSFVKASADASFNCFQTVSLDEVVAAV